MIKDQKMARPKPFLLALASELSNASKSLQADGTVPAATP